MLYQKEFETSAWGKIYKRSVIADVVFPVGKIYEDIGTIYKFILNAKRVVYSNRKIYYYLQRSDSIMGRPYKKNDLDYVYQAEKLLNDIKNINDKDLIRAAESRYVSTNFSVLLKLKKCNSDDEIKNELISNIRKYGLNMFFNRKVRIKNKVAWLLTFVNYF